MCRKYHVRGEDLTLKQVIARVHSKNQPVILAPKVVYSKQEIVSASKVLERLRLHSMQPVRTI
jgi:hypothetical protein